MSKTILFPAFLAVMLSSLVAFAQPFNDDCSNATLLTVGPSCTMQPFDSENQTAEDPQPAPNPGCGFFQGTDVWFKAVVPGSGSLRFERVNGSLNAQWAIYSGTCGNMEVEACGQLDAARTFHWPDLAGQEIYIRVFNYASAVGGTFELCLWEPQTPINNYCVNAINLTVGQICELDTFVGVFATADTSSNIPNPGCGFYGGGDVWFTFDLPVSGELRIDRVNVTGNAQYAVYSGDCNGMEVVDCAQLDAGTTLVLPDLAGQTLYLRVFGYGTDDGADFGICLWDPPVPDNDLCADAISLAVGPTCTMQPFSGLYATSDSVGTAPNPGCGFYGGGDIWFTFEVPASGEFRIERTNISGNAQYAVYDGTCGNFSVLDCAQLDGETTLVLPDHAGQTLYLRVFDYGSEEGAEFEICIWDPPVPENDMCADAINLNVGQTCTMQSFDGRYATADSSGTAPNPGCGFYQGGDVWFTFEVPSSGEVRIERNSFSGSAQYAVYSGVCGNMEVIDCAQQDPETTLVLPDWTNQTLYLRVFDYSSEEGGEFDICLWDPPIPENDLCANAIPMPVGDTCNLSAYTSLYATTDSSGTAQNPGCGFYSGGDVWFTMEVPSTGMLHLERGNISGNAQFALYEGTCGNFSSVISCAQLSSEMEINEPSLAGETVYMRVFGYNSEEGAEFEFCAYDTICNSFGVSVIQVGNELWAQESGQGPFIYQWSDCSGAIVANTYQFSPSFSGDYRVRLTNSIGCYDISDCFNFTLTGIEETLEPQFQVYPNPSNGIFNIAFSNTSSVNVQVIDIQGKVVLKYESVQEQLSLDLAEYPDGIYTLEVITDDGIIRKKLVLQR